MSVTHADLTIERREHGTGELLDALGRFLAGELVR